MRTSPLPWSVQADPAFADWFNLDKLNAAATSSPPQAACYREFLKQTRATLSEKFRANADIIELIHARSWAVDQVLTHCWKQFATGIDAALVAVGGYGRRELLPGSDVDVMILLQAAEDQQSGARLEAFLMFLWDIGLEVGYSVRTLEECREQARGDITVATNLMEARLVCGPQVLFERLRECISARHIWPDADFFHAKFEEQRARYRRYDDAVYNLEPNVKEGPGGLRDGQMLAWVFKRHYGSSTLRDLISQNLISDDEYRTLMNSQRFLWKVRFGLHEITRRREDRLLFDHQRSLAQLFGYTDSGHRLAVELFMKDYYLAIQALSRLNEMLLQSLQEHILYGDDPGEPQPINRRFQSRRGYLEVAYPTVFRHYPFALLEVFLLMQQHPELKGVSAATIRLIRSHRHLIDDGFRNDLRCRALFMEIFRQPSGLTQELRRMNRYGILAAYYPTFGRIVGQTQHDLFHVYTVDEHTLFVIRNLRRFSVAQHAHEVPLCSQIAESIPKRELLYLAGFFHDIAKGRGGSHSELGAADAREFLALHDLSSYDQNLVAWLVENHLLMSDVAQRRDIYDPDIIHAFATHVGDRVRLDYLYLLTVADIRGTNPTLWNDWKNSLFGELYTATRRALSRGLENPLHREELINDLKATALNRLIDEAGLEAARIENLWHNFPDDYFLRSHVNEVMWHVQSILSRSNNNETLVKFREKSERGGSALFIYTPVSHSLFSRTTGLIDQLGLSITEARIFTTENDYALDSYQLLNANGDVLVDPYQIQELITLMRETLDNDNAPALVSRPPPRRHRQFKVPTRVNFLCDAATQRTIVELVTTDSPGLLSRVGRIFYNLGIDLQNAKVATFGAQAEDVFHVSNRSRQPLSETEQLALREQLIEALDQRG